MHNTRAKLAALMMITALFVGCTSTQDLTNRDINAALELAQLQISQGQWDEALSTYDKALDIAPTDAKLLYNKTVALLLAGRFQEAADLAQQGFELHPNLIRFKLAQAESLKLAGKEDAAIEVYQTILTMDPADYDSRANLMELLVQMKYYESAKLHSLELISRKKHETRALEAMVTIDQATGGTGQPWLTIVETGFPTSGRK